MKMKLRRVIAVMLAMASVVVWLVVNPASYEQIFSAVEMDETELEATKLEDISAAEGKMFAAGEADENEGVLATEVLAKLEVKGRAPKTGYSREEFYKNWPTVEGCNLRQRIIRREFGESAVLDGCTVLAGEYNEPYTGEHKVFREKAEIAKGVQIDHVVALSDAWQKGAQYMEAEVRFEIATDPLNLLAVDAAANQKKSDGDAATWLPANKKFRCQYVARQISVKYKYGLWVTEAEKQAISKVLATCPNEKAIGI